MGISGGVLAGAAAVMCGVYMGSRLAGSFAGSQYNSIPRRQEARFFETTAENYMRNAQRDDGDYHNPDYARRTMQENLGPQIVESMIGGQRGGSRRRSRARRTFVEPISMRRRSQRTNEEIDYH